MIVSRFRSRFDAHAVRQETTWSAFCDALDRPVVWGKPKLALPMYAPTAFVGDHRSKPDVEHVFALTFDLDVAPLRRPKDVARILAGHACSVHTSFSHATEAPRSRLHMLPSRPLVGWREQSRVWAHVAALLGESGIGVGVEAKDASRASFVAAHAPGAPYEHVLVDGAPLDADAILSTVAEQEAGEDREREARKRYYEERDRRRKKSVADYPTRALARASENVRNATARHSTLNREVYCVGRFVESGELAAHVVREAMIQAGRAAGLSDYEATRTVDGALRARKVS